MDIWGYVLQIQGSIVKLWTSSYAAIKNDCEYSAKRKWIVWSDVKRTLTWKLPWCIANWWILRVFLVFLENSVATKIQWFKSLICFLCSFVAFFRLCNNICSIAFRVTRSAPIYCWLSSSWLGALSKEQSCFVVGDSSNIRWLVISPPLYMPCEWNMIHTMTNAKNLEPLVTSYDLHLQNPHKPQSYSYKA